MNFQQLRYVRETVRQGLNLTEAAAKLFTSQPGVSKQIRELEDELGVEIFVRRGKRIVSLTPPGEQVLKIAERVLDEADNLKRVATEFRDREAGTFSIATTHTQARYALPRVVSEFRKKYPKVHLSLQQGNPQQVAQMVIDGVADIGVATEALSGYPELLALPAYSWSHCVLVPPGHALLRAQRLTLDVLAKHPIVTYDAAFTGRTHIDEAFVAKGLKPDIVLAAVDSDVIKAYVELGLGVGIVASMAFDEQRDRELRRIDAAHLFPTNTSRIAVKRGVFLRGYVYEFLELFAPQLSRKLVERALKGGQDMYEL